MPVSKPASTGPLDPAKAGAKPPPTKSPAAKKAPAGRPASGRTQATRASATRASAARASAARAASAKTGSGKGGPTIGRRTKSSKSIVSQRRMPWGLIITTAIVMVFAIGVVAFAVTRTKKLVPDRYNSLTEVAAAKSIKGVVFKREPNHNHLTTTVAYNTSPPTGGDHSQYWADCTGVVYPAQVANENAVHALEHGAVWITYRPGLDTADTATLAKKVNGFDRMFMTPYAGLKTPISLQAWGYQLFVDSAADPRIDAFIAALKNNQDTLPEIGTTCSDPQFKASPSTPAKPLY